MKTFNISILSVLTIALTLFASCKKGDDEVYKPIPDAVYVTSNAVTGTGPGASTTITNSASGKYTVASAVARVYVNTLKAKEVVVGFALSGTAIAGTNYTVPASNSVTIPAGKWYADIIIPVNNVVVPANRTIIVTLTSASNNAQIGIGTDRNYKVFTYSITP
jgi:hypothetical protein